VIEIVQMRTMFHSVLVIVVDVHHMLVFYFWGITIFKCNVSGLVLCGISQCEIKLSLWNGFIYEIDLPRL